MLTRRRRTRIYFPFRFPRLPIWGKRRRKNIPAVSGRRECKIRTFKTRKSVFPAYLMTIIHTRTQRWQIFVYGRFFRNVTSPDWNLRHVQNYSHKKKTPSRLSSTRKIYKNNNNIFFEWMRIHGTWTFLIYYIHIYYRREKSPETLRNHRTYRLVARWSDFNERENKLHFVKFIENKWWITCKNKCKTFEEIEIHEILKLETLFFKVKIIQQFDKTIRFRTHILVLLYYW